MQLVNGAPKVVGDDPGKTVVDFGYDESGKFYDFAGSVEELAEFCAQQGARLDACFDGDGEESDDFWRIDVTDNKVTHQDAAVVYDDGQAALRAEGWQVAHDQFCTHAAKSIGLCHKNPYRS